MSLLDVGASLGFFKGAAASTGADAIEETDAADDASAADDQNTDAVPPLETRRRRETQRLGLGQRASLAHTKWDSEQFGGLDQRKISKLQAVLATKQRKNHIPAPVEAVVTLGHTGLSVELLILYRSIFVARQFTSAAFEPHGEVLPPTRMHLMRPRSVVEQAVLAHRIEEAHHTEEHELAATLRAEKLRREQQEEMQKKQPTVMLPKRKGHGKGNGGKSGGKGKGKSKARSRNKGGADDEEDEGEEAGGPDCDAGMLALIAGSKPITNEVVRAYLASRPASKTPLLDRIEVGS